LVSHFQDLVWLSTESTEAKFIPQQHMRDKGEVEFLGDKLTKA
jgi:hypothetical protein